MDVGDAKRESRKGNDRRTIAYEQNQVLAPVVVASCFQLADYVSEEVCCYRAWRDTSLDQGLARIAILRFEVGERVSRR